MVENYMVIHNTHDSSSTDCTDYCKACDGEIYFGEPYFDFEGDFLHDDITCIRQYVEDHADKKVAGV
ncbi:hypothetical protein BK708_36900 [Bacillus thuringiensis serovar yunnanensis]|nr:hypothetical protein BK708_36900 [Bacillus thuringiensis serovar yunnanensis]